MIVTGVFLTALEYNKFVFGRGSAPEPSHSAPGPSSWFKEPYF